MSGNFSKLDPITGAEQIATFSQPRDEPYYVTISALIAYIKSIFVSPEYITTITAVTEGLTVTLTDDSTNQWALFTPATGLTAATAVLPLYTNCIDGQEIILTTTETITTLTINKNGATAVNGDPGTLTAAAPLKLRYNTLTTSWYKVI